MASVEWLALLIAFLPPIAWLVWVRNLEIREREPWREVAKMFVWGATLGVVLALVLSYGTFYFLEPWWQEKLDADASLFAFAVIAAVVVAPLAEEPAKALGLTFLVDTTPEPEDGLVYGAAVGLGFASTENLFYMLSAFEQGGLASLLVVGGIRSFASAFLHASASALVGYGFLRTGNPIRRVAFLGLAILLHMTYNGLLSAEGILPWLLGLEETDVRFLLLGFVGALALSIAVFKLIRRQVQKLDAAGASSP